MCAADFISLSENVDSCDLPCNVHGRDLIAKALRLSEQEQKILQYVAVHSAFVSSGGLQVKALYFCNLHVTDLTTGMLLGKEYISTSSSIGNICVFWLLLRACTRIFKKRYRFFIHP